MLQLTFQLLHALGVDRIQSLVSQVGDQMHLADRFLCRNATGFLPVRSRVAIDEPWPECVECGDLLRSISLRLRVGEFLVPLTFPGFAPALGRCSCRYRSFTALAVFGVIREDQPNVHLPATPAVRSEDYAHRCDSFSDGARRFWSSQCSRSSRRTSTRRPTCVTPGNCLRPAMTLIAFLVVRSSAAVSSAVSTKGNSRMSFRGAQPLSGRTRATR